MDAFIPLLPKWAQLIIVILTIIGSGGAGAWLVSLYKTRKEESRADEKQEAELKKTETELALSMFKDYIANIRKDIETLQANTKLIELREAECRNENMRIVAKIRELETKVAALELKNVTT